MKRRVGRVGLRLARRCFPAATTTTTATKTATTTAAAEFKATWLVGCTDTRAATSPGGSGRPLGSRAQEEQWDLFRFCQVSSLDCTRGRLSSLAAKSAHRPPSYRGPIALGQSHKSVAPLPLGARGAHDGLGGHSTSSNSFDWHGSRAKKASQRRAFLAAGPNRLVESRRAWSGRAGVQNEGEAGARAVFCDHKTLHIN